MTAKSSRTASAGTSEGDLGTGDARRGELELNEFQLGDEFLIEETARPCFHMLGEVTQTIVTGTANMRSLTRPKNLDFPTSISVLRSKTVPTTPCRALSPYANQ